MAVASCVCGDSPSVVRGLEIALRILDVENRVGAWEQMVQSTCRPDLRHTRGSYYRLFLHEVLPSHVEHVLYSDTDVVFLANLAALWRQRDPTVMFQWGPLR